MNPATRPLVLSLGLLLAIALLGVFLGRGGTDPSEARPRTPLLDVAAFESVELLPPEQREPWLGEAEFLQPPPPHPLRDARRAAAARADSGVAPGATSGSDAVSAGARTPPAVYAPGAGAAAPGPGWRSYRVRERDSLERIARREYGDARLWRPLAEVNGITDPGRLRLGATLWLPPAEALRGESPAVAAAAADPAGAAADFPRRYRVREGETVSQISQKVYGTSRHWEHILAANGLSRPEELRAGVELVIPPPPR